jgi:putative endonuclease
MYYVYIIQSLKDNSYYKGFSINPLKRLTQHNNKETNYTANKTPWQLVYIEIYHEKKEALQREKALKKYSQSQLQQLINSTKNQINELFNHDD